MSRNSPSRIQKPPRHSRHAMAVRLRDEKDLDDLLERATDPIALFLDGVQDPHNLGACLRTASGAGVAAVIAPRKGACGVTETVRDVSCGGADEVPFLQVANINNTIQRLKRRGLRMIGTSDRRTQSLYATDFTGPLGLVLGSEGWGLRKKTASLCDERVRIPMRGDQVACLNVSVSAGVCLYEAVRQREFAETG